MQRIVYPIANNSVNTTRYVKSFVLAMVICLYGEFVKGEELEINQWPPALGYGSDAITSHYTFAAPATKVWRLCIAFPHLKDAYWLGVNYGMVKEAERLGVEIRISEAGGYPNIERQKKQILECTSDTEVDALIVGTVTFDGLLAEIRSISEKMPVFAAVNDIIHDGISGKVGVSWAQMGQAVGEYLRAFQTHEDKLVRILWFPGPRDAGWVPFIEQGFKQAIEGSSIELVASYWGDTGKAIQRNLIEQALQDHPDVDYLVGNALMAEAAVSVLNKLKLQAKIKVISSYFTPGVYRGIKRDKILAAPSDSPVLQGRLSINQAVNMLERRPYKKHIGPTIELLDKHNIDTHKLQQSLAPHVFAPRFYYSPKNSPE